MLVRNKRKIGRKEAKEKNMGDIKEKMRLDNEEIEKAVKIFPWGKMGIQHPIDLMTSDLKALCTKQIEKCLSLLSEGQEVEPIRIVDIDLTEIDCPLLHCAKDVDCVDCLREVAATRQQAEHFAPILAENTILKDKVKELEKELAGHRAFAEHINEALNSGDGVYRP